MYKNEFYKSSISYCQNFGFLKLKIKKTYFFRKNSHKLKIFEKFQKQPYNMLET